MLEVKMWINMFFDMVDFVGYFVGGILSYDFVLLIVGKVDEDVIC